MSQKPLRNSVPCNGCKLCCINDLIVLHPEYGDVVSDYSCSKQINPLTGHESYVLARKDNGECIYLGASGCTIYDNAPAICREFDCRRWFLKFTRYERRMLVSKGKLTKAIFDAGRQRLESLT